MEHSKSSELPELPEVEICHDSDFGDDGEISDTSDVEAPTQPVSMPSLAVDNDKNDKNDKTKTATIPPQPDVEVDYENDDDDERDKSDKTEAGAATAAHKPEDGVAAAAADASADKADKADAAADKADAAAADKMDKIKEANKAAAARKLAELRRRREERERLNKMTPRFDLDNTSPAVTGLRPNPPPTPHVATIDATRIIRPDYEHSSSSSDDDVTVTVNTKSDAITGAEYLKHILDVVADKDKDTQLLFSGLFGGDGLLTRDDICDKINHAMRDHVLFGTSHDAPAARAFKAELFKNRSGVNRVQAWQLANVLLRALHAAFPERAHGELDMMRKRPANKDAATVHYRTLPKNTTKTRSAELVLKVLCGPKPRRRTVTKTDTKSQSPDKKRARKADSAARYKDQNDKKDRNLPRQVSDNVLAAAIVAYLDTPSDAALLAGFYRALPSQLFQGAPSATHFVFGTFDKKATYVLRARGQTPREVPAHDVRAAILERAKHVLARVQQGTYFADGVDRLPAATAKKMIDDINDIELHDLLALKAIARRKRQRTTPTNFKAKSNKLDQLLTKLRDDDRDALQQARADAAAAPHTTVTYTANARELLNIAFGQVLAREIKLAKRVATNANRTTVTGHDAILVNMVQRLETAAGMPAPTEHMRAAFARKHEARATLGAYRKRA